MQEFVLVTFVEDRRVFVGGQHVGNTNAVFSVTTGIHTVFLEDPRDYGPSSLTQLVQHTRRDDPFIFNFVKSTHVQGLLARARLEGETEQV